MTQLLVSKGLLNIQQELGLAFQVIVAQLAVRRCPRQLQAIILRPQLDRKISVHGSMKTYVKNIAERKDRILRDAPSHGRRDHAQLLHELGELLWIERLRAIREC